MTGDGDVFYEDLDAGKTYRHKNGRTVTDVDNIWFSLLTCNANQIHFNADYARRNFAKMPFRGRLIVNAFLTLAVTVGLSVEDISRNGIMLGLADLKVMHPVFAGDTIYSVSRVISKRLSRSHRGMGIVRIRTVGTNQDGIKVIRFERTVMVRRRGKKWA
jgi:itaconyl-CoA hydratase